MKFTDHWFDAAAGFALGSEEDSGRHYLSIPVCNGLVDYEEHYVIDAATNERYCADPASAAGFVQRCRARGCDELLFVEPGSNRGTAI